MSHVPRRLRAYIEAVVTLEDMWGGSHAVGLELVRAHYAGQDVTADSLAVACRISDDTARRRLDRLLKDAKVWMLLEGGARRYRATPAMVDETMAVLSEAEAHFPQVAVEGGLPA